MFVGREDEIWEKIVKKMMFFKCIVLIIVCGSLIKILKEWLNNIVVVMFYDIKYDEWREELIFKLKIRIENVDIIKWFFFFEFSEER